MTPAPDTLGVVLAQSPAGTDDRTVLAIVGVIAVVAVVVAFYWLRLRSRSARVGSEPRRETMASEQERQGMTERDQKLFDQHVQLNALTADKLHLEAQYLRLQTDLARKELDARERMDKYHDLMTQKAQLEVQSLRLHIREQRKRLDDFTNSGDD